MTPEKAKKYLTIFCLDCTSLSCKKQGKNEGKNNKLKKRCLIVFLLLQKSDRRWKSNKPWRSHIAINKKAKVKDWTNTIRRKAIGKTHRKGRFDIQIAAI